MSKLIFSILKILAARAYEVSRGPVGVLFGRQSWKLTRGTPDPGDIKGQATWLLVRGGWSLATPPSLESAGGGRWPTCLVKARQLTSNKQVKK